MPISYSLISRGTTVLFEHAFATGNVSKVATQVINRLPPHDTKVTYSIDKHYFHVVVKEGFTFMCLCDKTFSRVRAFGFLSKIQREFTSGVRDRDFDKVLASEMRRYSSGDQLVELQSQVIIVVI
jgi:vesicle-associated membrane protein 7